MDDKLTAQLIDSLTLNPKQDVFVMVLPLWIKEDFEKVYGLRQDVVYTPEYSEIEL